MKKIIFIILIFSSHTYAGKIYNNYCEITKYNDGSVGARIDSEYKTWDNLSSSEKEWCQKSRTDIRKIWKEQADKRIQIAKKLNTGKFPRCRERHGAHYIIDGKTATHWNDLSIYEKYLCGEIPKNEHERIIINEKINENNARVAKTIAEEKAKQESGNRTSTIVIFLLLFILIFLIFNSIKNSKRKRNEKETSTQKSPLKTKPKAANKTTSHDEVSFINTLNNKEESPLQKALKYAKWIPIFTASVGILATLTGDRVYQESIQLVINSIIFGAVPLFLILWIYFSIKDSNTTSTVKRTVKKTTKGFMSNKPKPKDMNEVANTLLKYKNLLDTGVISQQEFDDIKKDLLSKK